jgi:hypothetical protein
VGRSDAVCHRRRWRLGPTDHGEIVAKGTRLVLERHRDEWIVDRP